MHPYLVGAAGLRLDLKESVIADIFDDMIISAGSPAPALGYHSHALAVTRISTDRCLDSAIYRSQASFHQHQISLNHGASLKLRGQIGMGCDIFCYQHYPRSLPAMP